MRSLFATLLAGALLAGCASPPPALLPGRDQIRDFALDARFALRVNTPDQAGQSAGGRLAWEHHADNDHLLLSSPLGYGVAEIDFTPTGARLLTADGEPQESTDPDDLVERVTGQRLPVSRLPAWLLGRSGGAAQISNDTLQRPARLTEAGWQIDYAYDSESAQALPARLTLKYRGEIELRLRIEDWRVIP